MHNKLFIADGVMAVAGGRNIADEYFMTSEGANFIDLDTFVIGAHPAAAVGDLRRVLEQRVDVPAARPIVATPSSRAEALRQRVRAAMTGRRQHAPRRPSRRRRTTCSATARS